MAYSIARLTLYALLTAVESDLRDAIIANLSPKREVSEILPVKIYERARDRMERDRGFDPDLETKVLEYLDFSESIEVLQSHKSDLDGTLQKAIRSIIQTSSEIALIRNRVMHSRPLEFDDFAKGSEFCKQLLSFPTYLFRKLRQAEEFIKADPRYVFSLNLDDIRSPAAKASHNLPIPDFDETGFLGRTDEASELLRICKASPWPVLTVLGEGGVGKTALALKVAYELLDDEEAGFDAVVWTSSKTTRLTGSDIENIDGAIRSSVGVFQDISRGLDENAANMEEILEYLNTFKILLILDNLETVLDEKIRSFLSRIASTSKVLITSRVGLGELEYRFPLRAMRDDEAVSLLRATAQVRRVAEIVRTNNTTLKTYCRKMKNNPLFIKWFVSSVQSGKRPEESLQNSGIFLDYCLANVVEHLSGDAQFLARAMVGIPGPHAQPMLAYITEMDGDRLQLALQQLITANVAILNAQPTQTGYESLYDLGDLPRLFLLKSYPPSRTEIAAFGRRRSELARTHEQIKAQATAGPYSLNTVAIRTRDDVVVAKYLTDAMQAVRQKRFEDATAFIERAKKIAPTFAEVYRVEGLAQYFLGNAAASREAYETAVELEPRSAAVRYWYAGFLLRAHHDAEAAGQQLRIAHEIDPRSPEIRVEYARALSYLFRFDEADDQLRPVIEERSGSTKLMRVAYDGWIQIAVRRGNFRLGNSDYLTALAAYEDTTERFRAIPAEYRDRRIIESVSQCIPQTMRIITELTHSDAGMRAEHLKETLYTIRNMIFDNEPLLGSHRAGLPTHLKIGYNGSGQIARIDPSGKFGFIRADGGGELFFHRTQMDFPNEILHLKEGDPVSFTVGENQQGLTAEQVNAAHSGTLIQSSDQRLLGVIARAMPERSFGFIRSDDGREFFFHRSELQVPGQHMSGLKVDTRVAFTPGKNDKGPIALSIELVVDDAFLDDAFQAARRIVATVSVHKGETTYGFATVEGSSHVLLRSQDFHDPAAWNLISIGDKVSFVLGKSPRGEYVGRDVEIEDKYWAP